MPGLRLLAMVGALLAPLLAADLVDVAPDLPPVADPLGFGGDLALRSALVESGVALSAGMTRRDLVQAYRDWLDRRIAADPERTLAGILLAPSATAGVRQLRLGARFPILAVADGQTPLDAIREHLRAAGWQAGPGGARHLLDELLAMQRDRERRAETARFGSRSIAKPATGSLTNSDLGIVAQDWSALTAARQPAPIPPTHSGKPAAHRTSGSGPEPNGVAPTPKQAEASQSSVERLVDTRWQFSLNVLYYYTINRASGVTGWISTDDLKDSEKFPSRLGNISGSSIVVNRRSYDVSSFVSQGSSAVITTNHNGLMRINLITERLIEITWQSADEPEAYTFRIRRP